MLDLAGRVLAAILRRIDDRASDVEYYGFGGRAWTGQYHCTLSNYGPL